MKKRARVAWAAGLLTASLLAGCASGGASSGGGSASIYYSAMDSGEYYTDWANTMGDLAGQGGYAYEVGFAEGSLEDQVAQVTAASGQCDVFLCGPLSSDIVTEIETAAGGKPIVFLNRAPYDDDLQKDKYIYVASDEYMAGQYQAEYILDRLADKQEINVVILKGPKDAAGAIQRTEGLKETLEASGKTIHYVFEDFGDWTSDTAKEMTRLFLKTGRPVDCVAGNNDDMALGALAAFEEAGVDTGDVLFLGVDASENGCQAIKDGRMDFSAFQPTGRQMELAVEAAGVLAGGGSIQEIEGATEDGKYILIPFEKVDSGNVDQYS